VRSYLEALGSWVLKDPHLLVLVGEGPPGGEDEAVKVEGFR